MFTDFDKLYLDSNIETERDTVGLAVYHLDIEMGIRPDTNQVKETISDSRVSIPEQNISSYLSSLKGNLIKEDNEGFKLSAEGLRYFDEKISEAESSVKYTDKLVNVDESPDRFYESLIEEINEAYTRNLFDAALILTRKLFENLIIDILRSKFGPENHLHLYYNEEKKQFKTFSSLIDNFDENSENLNHYYTSDTDEIIQKLENFRADANSSAHSIETDLEEEDFKEWSSDIDFLSRLLINIKEKVES